MIALKIIQIPLINNQATKLGSKTSGTGGKSSRRLNSIIRMDSWKLTESQAAAEIVWTR